jgi:hypothetical protein
MKPISPHPKKLLVEGKDDVCAIAGLMGHYVVWGTTAEDWPVEIVPEGSVDEVLQPRLIATYAKERDIEAIGVVIDANECFASRWRRLRDRLSEVDSSIPGDLPPEGLVQVSPEGPRLGAWIMPDNRGRGMLETFLAFLVPSESDALWDHAKASTAAARRNEAPFKVAHKDKAEIHTWLAWQDPPGDPLGLALTKKCLLPTAHCAKEFADWFIRLFQLDGQLVSSES